MILFALSQEAWDKLSEAEQREIILEFAAAMNLGIHRVLQWATELDRINSRLVSGRYSSSDVSLFWVRLHGLLVEMDSFYAPLSLTPQNSILKRVIAIDTESRKRYLAIRAVLTDDEVVYVDYHRNLGAHCFVTSYFLKGKAREGTLKLSRTRFVQALGRECQLTEIRDAIRRVEQVGPPAKVAAALASKIKDSVTGYAGWLNTPFDIFGNGALPSAP